jgi:hypothetical protein
VVDLGWWSDEFLLLAFVTGEVIISPLHQLQNLLGADKLYHASAGLS